MLIHFDFSSNVPLYRQLRDQIVLGIASKQLLPGEKLPTVRALAEESGVNAMTISKAYQLLRQEGYIQTDRRAGAVVCPLAEEIRVPEQTVEALRLHLSELHLAGMDRAAVLALCEKLFQEVEQG